MVGFYPCTQSILRSHLKGRSPTVSFPRLSRVSSLKSDSSLGSQSIYHSNLKFLMGLLTLPRKPVVYRVVGRYQDRRSESRCFLPDRGSRPSRILFLGLSVSGSLSYVESSPFFLCSSSLSDVSSLEEEQGHLEE